MPIRRHFRHCFLSISARDPLQYFAGTCQKSPGKKTPVFAFCSRTGFCHGFPDVVKETLDLHFHVGEWRGGKVSNRQLQGISEGLQDAGRALIP
jgi:hypothetical protein